MKSLKPLIILLVLAFCAYVVWLWQNHLFFYSRTVLKAPIQFEHGFSLTREFDVGPAATYWVGIEYQKVFRSSATMPYPRNEFTAKFDVFSKDRLVAHGGSDTFPSWQEPWILSRDHVVRGLAPFDAKAGLRYKITIQIVNASSELASAEPRVMVYLDPLFDESYSARGQFVICSGVGIGILVAVYVAGHLVRSRARKQG